MEQVRQAVRVAVVAAQTQAQVVRVVQLQLDKEMQAVVLQAMVAQIRQLQVVAVAQARLVLAEAQTHPEQVVMVLPVQ
jgi:hypothetical protein